MAEKKLIKFGTRNQIIRQMRRVYTDPMLNQPPFYGAVSEYFKDEELTPHEISFRLKYAIEEESIHLPPGVVIRLKELIPNFLKVLIHDKELTKEAISFWSRKP